MQDAVCKTGSTDGASVGRSAPTMISSFLLLHRKFLLLRDRQWLKPLHSVTVCSRPNSLRRVKSFPNNLGGGEGSYEKEITREDLELTGCSFLLDLLTILIHLHRPACTLQGTQVRSLVGYWTNTRDKC